MTEEQIVKVDFEYPDGSKYITGYRKLERNANPNRGIWDASRFGDKIGLWTWYAGNGNVSKQIIYIL